MTLPWRAPFPTFPRPPPRRGWQRSEQCSQSFAPRMARQHVWGGTPGHHGARSGSWSPSSILLHAPYEVQRMDVRSPPDRKRPEAGAQRTLEGVGCRPWFGSEGEPLYRFPPWSAPRRPHVPCPRARGWRQSNPGGAYGANCGKSSVTSNHGAFSCVPQKI